MPVVSQDVQILMSKPLRGVYKERPGLSSFLPSTPRPTLAVLHQPSGAIWPILSYPGATRPS